MDRKKAARKRKSPKAVTTKGTELKVERWSGLTQTNVRQTRTVVTTVIMLLVLVYILRDYVRRPSPQVRTQGYCPY